eukprot:2172000-Pleurochrysis_carterae.AAC.1
MEEVSKSLSGRDCKIFAERAGDIFPDLLNFALAPQEAIESAVSDTMDEARAQQDVRGAIREEGDN